MKSSWQASLALVALSVLGVLGAVPPARAQPPLVNDPPLRFHYLTLRDGLSQTGVRHLVQDHLGFLWIATEDGLNRFDGHDFKVYRHRPGDPASAPSGAIMELIVDAEGVLWLGTHSFGLSRFDPVTERFVHHRHDADDAATLSADQVLALYSTAADLWVGTAGGVDRLDPATGRVERCGSDEMLIADVIAGAADGRLWIGNGDGLFLFAPTTCTIVSQALSLPVNNVHRAADGSLWIGTQRGLYEIPPEGGEAVPRSLRRAAGDGEEPAVYAIIRDRRGDLWVGSQAGLFHLAGGETSVYVHDPADPNSLLGTKFREFLEDAEGNLWFSIYGIGVVRFHPEDEPFRTHALGNVGEDLGKISVRAFHQDSLGRSWIGTESSGALVGDLASGVFRPAVLAPAGEAPRAVYDLEENDGRLWVASDYGVFSAPVGSADDGSPWQHFPAGDGDDSLNDYLVRILRFDRDGVLWVGTKEGLNSIGRDLEVRRVPLGPDGSQHDVFIFDIHEDRSGKLWVGSVDGLSIFDRGPQEFIHYRHDGEVSAGLQAGSVLDVFEDRSGKMWLGTLGGGLHAVTGDDPRRLAFDVYTSEDGLNNNVVYSILEDGLGRLWLGTNGGLSCFDPATGRFFNFDLHDGLQDNEFTTNAALLSTDGSMYFGGPSGYNHFRPDRFVDVLRRPPVALTAFEVFHSDRHGADGGLAPPYMKEVVLSHREGFFALEFAALSFRRPRRNRYSYRLQNFDKGWIDAESRRYASYTNVPPGEYTFVVRAANNGAWNHRGAQVRITILPPWWKTWWAYALYVLLTVAPVAAYLRLQRSRIERERAVNRKLREVDRLKDDFLANTSHELRTPLYGMTGLAESLIDGARGELSETARHDLSLIVASGRRLATLVDSLLDFSKLRHKTIELRRQPVDLHALADVVLTLSRPLVGKKALVLKNAVPGDLPTADADEDRLTQVLHNLVGNAIKFTGEGLVEVSAEVAGDQLVLHVRDTGIGISEEAQGKVWNAFEQADASLERTYGGTGLGLTVTRQLVELHGGRIWLESVPGEGSVFSLTLPIAEGKASPSTGAFRVEDAPAVDEPEPAGAAADVLATNGRILVVDDEPVNLRVLRNHLRLAGYEAVTAALGEEALALLDGAQDTFDLVLLDVMMPRLSGYEVCRRIRQRWSPQELPILFLTAKSQLADLVDGFAAGANDYLNKPIAKDELLARVRAHRDLQEVHRQMNHLVDERNRQLVERERLIHELDRFNYTVSHDLRNPLTTIKNFTGMLRHSARRGETERLVEDVEHIDSAADTMRDLLDELIEYSRIGTELPKPEAVALDEIVEAAGRRLQERASCEIERGSGTLGVVRGDPALLLVVFEHLFDNAVKFSGGSRARITVGRRAEEGSSTVTVRDEGIGLAAAYYEKVFGLFNQLDPDGPGTGVGLALVRRIVDAHGGRVWVESEGAGRGCTFCVTLPAAPGGSLL